MSAVRNFGPVSILAEGAIFVNAWSASPGARELYAVRDAQLDAHTAHGKLGVITIIRPTAMPRIDEGLRRASAALRRELGPTFASSAFLIDEDGFLAAFARSLLSGIHALAPASYPTRVHRDVLVTAAWTAEQLARHGHDLTPEHIAGRIQRVRAVMDGL